MPSAAQALRTALDAFRSAEGRARLYRMRGAADDYALSLSHAQQHAQWLSSPAAREALAEARESGELGQRQLERLVQQLSAAGHAARMLQAERRLRAGVLALEGESGAGLSLREQLPRIARADDAKHRANAAREVEEALRPLALTWVEDCARAEQPLAQATVGAESAAAAPAQRPATTASGLLLVSSLEQALAEPSLGLSGAKPGPTPAGASSAPAHGLPPAPEAESLRAFLDATDDALEEALRLCARGHTREFPLPWNTWLHVLRAPELDSDSGSKVRWRRVACWLRELGFERELSSGLRAELDRGALHPGASVCLPQPSGDVRVGQGRIDFGVASDLFASEAVARGLGLCLRMPLLPAELRWPLPGASADALGGLSAQLWAEPGQLMRLQGMSESEAKRVSAVAAAQLLSLARAACAFATLELPPRASARERLEALAVTGARATGSDLPPGVAGLLGGDRVGWRARALGLCGGLALHASLRERYDEDFYRNRRAGEPLRHACTRGNGFGLLQLLAELGGSLSLSRDRALELVS